jgi:hypothetical protein
VERRQLVGDLNELKRGFTMEHNESLMGKHELAQLSQYSEQASSWMDKIRMSRQVLPNYYPTENLIKIRSVVLGWLNVYRQR